jgi:hypothetical protein
MKSSTFQDRVLGARKNGWKAWNPPRFCCCCSLPTVLRTQRGFYYVVAEEFSLVGAARSFTTSASYLNGVHHRPLRRWRIAAINKGSKKVELIKNEMHKETLTFVLTMSVVFFFCPVAFQFVGADFYLVYSLLSLVYFLNTFSKKICWSIIHIKSNTWLILY